MDTVLVQLKPSIGERWQELGMALGIANNLLKEFELYTPEQRLIEVVDYWLVQHVGKPTWAELGDACSRVGLVELGTALKSSYERGS